MLYRVFVADMGKFKQSKNYEFIAEFASKNLTNQYIRWMRGKERFRTKDIIIREYEGEEINPADGEVSAVISVLGESLPLEEYDFS